MSGIASWSWRTTAPATIAREIVARAHRQGAKLFVFLSKGRIILRAECEVQHHEDLEFSVSPIATEAEVMMCLTETTERDAREGGLHVRTAKGALRDRILDLLTVRGALSSAEIATKLGHDLNSVRATLSLLRTADAIHFTEDRVQFGRRSARKYAITEPSAV